MRCDEQSSPLRVRTRRAIDPCSAEQVRFFGRLGVQSIGAPGITHAYAPYGSGDPGRVRSGEPAVLQHGRIEPSLPPGGDAALILNWRCCCRNPSASAGGQTHRLTLPVAFALIETIKVNGINPQEPPRSAGLADLSSRPYRRPKDHAVRRPNASALRCHGSVTRKLSAPKEHHYLTVTSSMLLRLSEVHSIPGCPQSLGLATRCLEGGSNR